MQGGSVDELHVIHPRRDARRLAVLSLAQPTRGNPSMAISGAISSSVFRPLDAGGLRAVLLAPTATTSVSAAI